MSYRVIGIDAGYGRPGLSIVDFIGPVWTEEKSNLVFSGYFETERKASKDIKVAIDDARRIRESCLWMRQLIDSHRPALVVVEMPLSGGKSAMAIKGMAMAAGYTAGLLTILEVDLQFKTVYYSPYDTKRICAGHQHAEKELMIAAAQHAWPSVKFPMKKTRSKGILSPHPGRSEAMADSLCAILTHVRLNLGKPIL